MTDANGPWSYTFCDMRTHEELATLPLTGVSYSRGIGTVGQLDGYLALTDPKVRALDPWRATEKRRTEVYVEYDGRVVWGGPVVMRDRSSESDGLTISAVTWEGWLHRQRLLNDLVFTNQQVRQAAALLVGRAQVLTDVGLDVDLTSPATSLRSRVHLAREIVPILELLERLGDEAESPVEFWVDCYRDDERRFRRTLRLGEPRIGRTYEAAPITFAYPSGDLTKWHLPEDGSAGNNVLMLLGAGSGEIQPFGVLDAATIGVDEVASGFPSWFGDLRASDTDSMAYILHRARAAMRTGFASEYLFTGVEVRPSAYLGRVFPGDDVALEIVHRSLKEWPAAVAYVTRVLAEAVKVGDGGDGDAVSLTVGGTPQAGGAA